MKLWIDDIRPAPEGYTWAKSVNDAKWFIRIAEEHDEVELIDIDHDAGDYYVIDGGDYIELLKWLEEKEFFKTKKRKYNIHIHSMNPVGVENMRRIIQRNGWKEVKE